jgi:glyoxylase-like metal-dependent hydrolase (beta-lactamase superfamily II)
MGNATFSFQVGTFECLVINDGTITTAMGVLEIQCLFIRTGKNNVLIDTGCGVGTKSDAGKLLQNLRAEGIRPEEIDTVINTHGHGDHLGGNADNEGRAIFSNARYIIHEREWDYWQAELALTQVEEGLHKRMIDQARMNLSPIQEKYDLIEGETEIVSGIKCILTPGHTPGHMGLVLSSGTDQLLCIGDLIRDPLELTQSDLYQAIDVNHEQAVQTRIQILSNAAASDNLVFACHFPFPGLGRFVKNGNELQWQPL